MAALAALYAGIFEKIDSSTVPPSSLALQPEDETLPTLIILVQVMPESGGAWKKFTIQGRQCGSKRGSHKW